MMCLMKSLLLFLMVKRRRHRDTQSGNDPIIVRESDVDFMNLDNENNESRKKVGQKLVTRHN